MASGVTAKVLHVDLSARQTRVEEIPEVTIRKYLGGGALACHLLLRDMPAGVDPLGPDNMLVFMTSVINGLSLSGTNRYTAAAKSPLTGRSEEHTSELQSHSDLVCRLLLEKKK